MKWTKLGMIFEPKGQYGWVKTHASFPFALLLPNGLYRVYFHGRDSENRSQPGYIEIDMEDPAGSTYLSPNPVVAVGRPGLFDDSGVLGPWIVENDPLLYMYYSGWMRGVNVPYHSAIGLAISRDGGRSFEKYSRAPIMDRNEIDPYLTISGCVLREHGIWRMWYVSANDFKIDRGKGMYYYHIKYAESNDGIQWRRNGNVCIDFAHPGETRIGSPCVTRERGLYRMWYCYAVDAYRIGYAESKDGIVWARKDEAAGIGVSKAGWDSEMVCYPFVFEHKGHKYMLYNGNGYGKTGIGLAFLQPE